MRYDRLKSEDGPLGYSIFKKRTQIKNSSGAFEHRQINLNYIYMQRILYSEILKKKIQKNVQFQWKTTTEVQVLRKHIAT